MNEIKFVINYLQNYENLNNYEVKLINGYILLFTD